MDIPFPAGGIFAYGSAKASHFGKALLCSPDILNGFFLSDELEVFIKQTVAVVANRDVVGKDDDLSRGTARQPRSSLGRTQKLRGPLLWTAFVFVHKTSAVSHHPVFNPCWDDSSSFVIPTAPLHSPNEAVEI